MTENEMLNKNLVLIKFLQSQINGFKIKAEYSTNDKDLKVIVVQETSGSKVVFFNNDKPLYNYYNIEIFGNNIEEEYKTSNKIGLLIGQTKYLVLGKEKWQLIFMQYSNPRTKQYMDIKRISYTMTLQCVINKISETEGT